MIMNKLISMWQALIYGLLKRASNIDLTDLPTNITLESGYDKENDVHFVFSPDLPEFVATGKTPQELAKNIGDTLLVYFDVPTYFARKFEDGSLTFTNRKTGETERVTVDKKALSESLA